MITIDSIESVFDEQQIIFLTYGGTFTQSLIAGMTGVLEKEVEEDELSMSASNNIFVVFIELTQNIMNYAKKLQKSRHFDPKGLIFVGKKGEQYFVCGQNIITDDDKTHIETILNEVTSLDKDALKQRYREIRRSGRGSHEKGSGLGFYEIARKVESLEYRFDKISEDRYYYKLCATIQ
jgi:hypothetical protein